MLAQNLKRPFQNSVDNSFGAADHLDMTIDSHEYFHYKSYIAFKEHRQYRGIILRQHQTLEIIEASFVEKNTHFGFLVGKIQGR